MQPCSTTSQPNICPLDISPRLVPQCILGQMSLQTINSAECYALRVMYGCFLVLNRANKHRKAISKLSFQRDSDPAPKHSRLFLWFRWRFELSTQIKQHFSVSKPVCIWKAAQAPHCRL